MAAAAFHRADRGFLQKYHHIQTGSDGFLLPAHPAPVHVKDLLQIPALFPVYISYPVLRAFPIDYLLSFSKGALRSQHLYLP